MSDKHLSTEYDSELDGLRNRVLEMGGLAEAQVTQSLYALTHLHAETAAQVLRQEQRVNAMEVEIDHELSTIIARRQPTARDLRLLIAVSKSIGHLERIGDEAARIARIVNRLVGSGISSRLRPTILDTGHSGRMATELLRRALDAVARLDADEGVAVIRDDPELDAEFDGQMRRLVTTMIEDPRTISASIELVFVAKAIERVGDHAKALAEQVIYAARGDDVRHTPLDDMVTRPH
jgi:phosphate transport system protein